MSNEVVSNHVEPKGKESGIFEIQIADLFETVGKALRDHEKLKMLGDRIQSLPDTYKLEYNNMIRWVNKIAYYMQVDVPEKKISDHPALNPNK